MSDDYDTHVILHHLDDPLRVLKWTLDEAAALIVPPFLSLLIEQLIAGFVLSIISFFVLRKLKKKCQGGALRHALYWYFPHRRSVFKKTPPSYIREYIS